MDLLEVVAGVVEVGAPVEAEPADVLLDAFDVFEVFFGGVGVVEAEVAAGAGVEGGVFLGEAEVEADGFGVADVEVAVGFWGEAGDDGGVFAGAEVVLDDFADEIEGFGGGWGGGKGHGEGNYLARWGWRQKENVGGWGRGGALGGV